MKIKNPSIKNFLIGLYIKAYPVNLAEALIEDPKGYESLEALFTRKLKPNARSLSQISNHLLSPADGILSHFGICHADTLIQAKNQFYTIQDLLATKEHTFQNCQYATIYLAPYHYHRVHSPITGRITEMTYIPGNLFSVNPLLAQMLPNLFTRNERVILNIESSEGNVVLIMVGAVIVGNITINWHGSVNSEHPRQLSRWSYKEKPIEIIQGQELGYFTFGSTVILLHSLNHFHWSHALTEGTEILLGQTLALP